MRSAAAIEERLLVPAYASRWSSLTVAAHRMLAFPLQLKGPVRRRDGGDGGPRGHAARDRARQADRTALRPAVRGPLRPRRTRPRTRCGDPQRVAGSAQTRGRRGAPLDRAALPPRRLDHRPRPGALAGRPRPPPAAVALAQPEGRPPQGALAGLHGWSTPGLPRTGRSSSPRWWRPRPAPASASEAWLPSTYLLRQFERAGPAALHRAERPASRRLLLGPVRRHAVAAAHRRAPRRPGAAARRRVGGRVCARLRVGPARGLPPGRHGPHLTVLPRRGAAVQAEVGLRPVSRSAGAPHRGVGGLRCRAARVRPGAGADRARGRASGSTPEAAR